jgi:hypothetical protein
MPNGLATGMKALFVRRLGANKIDVFTQFQPARPILTDWLLCVKKPFGFLVDWVVYGILSAGLETGSQNFHWGIRVSVVGHRVQDASQPREPGVTDAMFLPLKNLEDGRERNGRGQYPQR